MSNLKNLVLIPNQNFFIFYNLNIFFYKFFQIACPPRSNNLRNFNLFHSRRTLFTISFRKPSCSSPRQRNHSCTEERILRTGFKIIASPSRSGHTSVYTQVPSPYLDTRLNKRSFFIYLRLATFRICRYRDFYRVSRRSYLRIQSIHPSVHHEIVYRSILILTSSNKICRL